MKALSIWQPYALAVARRWKPIENRSWAPAASLLKPGEYFAVHASKRSIAREDELAVLDMAADADIEPDVLEAIRALTPAHFGAVIAVARYEGTIGASSLRDNERAWWVGPKAWRLSDVVELPEPMPLRGMQGLFNVPPEMNEQLWATVAALKK